ncbi:MAG TPA: hypothetical protein VI078_03190 [bacterium]
MPIEHTIDREKRLVTAALRGVVTYDELAEYERRVWSSPEVAGFDELVDMSRATDIEDDTVNNVERLASLAARLDAARGPSRLAIFAASDLHFGMGRMYKALREGRPGAVRTVEVFRDRGDAERWLSSDSSVPE